MLQATFTTVHEIIVKSGEEDGNDVKDYFSRIGKWLDNALTDPSFARSRRGRDSASDLYDKGQNYLTLDTKLSENAKKVVDELQMVIEGVQSDRSSQRLILAYDQLMMDVRLFAGETVEQGRKTAVHWRLTLLRAAFGWLLPQVLKVITVLPMPRVEYLSVAHGGSGLAAAVDTLLVVAREDLLPDYIKVQGYSEVIVMMDEQLGSAILTSPNSRLLSTGREGENGSSESAFTPLPSNEISDHHLGEFATAVLCNVVSCTHAQTAIFGLCGYPCPHARQEYYILSGLLPLPEH
jgi:hypothetical protein